MLLAALLALFVSCGYRSDLVYEEGEKPELCFPYVIGDSDGALTAEIVRIVSPYFTCDSEKGDYLLKISICDDFEENVGFRYDRTRKDRLKHYIIPVETRRYIEVEAELLDRNTLKSVKGPVVLTAFTEFDHEYETVRDNANTFSLGQLTDYDAAWETSDALLYSRLAQKVLWFLMYLDFAIEAEWRTQRLEPEA
jgi:hypothetical protein